MYVSLFTGKFSKTLAWLYRYKTHHLIFWLAYHYMWWTIAIGSATEAAYNILFSDYTTKFVFYVVFQAISVYFNLYYLIPRFLERRKYPQYLISLTFTILVTAIIITSGYYVNAYISSQSYEALFGDQSFIHLFKTNSLRSTLASMTLAMSIKLAKNWIKSQQRQQLLEKEKTETELKFLKSQFNPHFLFNTINSIFVLIHKNPDKASESLANFSDLMRYQLYECNEGKIPLAKEINYLQNFIELGKLRLDSTVKVTTNIKNLGYGNVVIAPFILMPFVENAFKHCSQGEDQNNWITIALYFSEKNIVLEVENTMLMEHQEHSDALIEHSGIGLKNVNRRLDLTYQNQYKLSIKENKETYKIQLDLQLDTAHTPSEQSAMPITLSQS